MLASYKGKKILCAQSGDTMTHKSHRKKGLFIKLAKMTYDTAKKEGIEFIFGFPSNDSFPGFKYKLNWLFPFKMLKFSRFILTFPYGLTKKKLKFNTGKFGYFSNKYLNYINKSKKDPIEIWSKQNNHNFEILRDKKYFFYKNSLPDNKYFLQNENLAIFLKYDGNISIGSILGSVNKSDIKTIFKTLDFLAFMTGSVQIRTYFSPDSDLQKLLSPFGKISKAMPYGYINLSNRYDPSKLNLTFLDYDYF